MNFYVVGAGFSKAVFPHAPLNNELLNVLAKRSSTSVAKKLLELYKSEDIENALTRLDLDISASSDRSKIELRKKIQEEIYNYFQSFSLSIETFKDKDWLASFIDNAISTNDIVVSLNYDCLIEGALDVRGKWSPNKGYTEVLNSPLTNYPAFEESPISVLKIHGSANFLIAPYIDKPSSGVVGFVFNNHYFPESAKHSSFSHGAGTGEPYLVAPSYVKIPSVEISYLMLDALKATSKAKNFVVIGTSFRPEDSFLSLLLTNFLRQPNWQMKKIIIIDPCAQAISLRIRKYWGVNVDKQIVSIQKTLEDSVSDLLKELGSQDVDAEGK